MLKRKWIIHIHIIFVLLSANCWSDTITSTTASANTQPDKRQTAITIQVSSHRRAERANSESQRLKSHGLDSYVEHERVNDKGMWYRVYVGQFENRKSATAFAKRLVEKGIISGFWVKKKLSPVNPAAYHEENQSKNQVPPINVQETQASGETDAKKIAPPPSPTAESYILAPAEIPKPKEIEKTSLQKTTPEAEGQPSAASATTTDKGDQEENKFSLGLKAGRSSVSRADDFIIYDAGEMVYWQLDNSYVLYFGLVANLRLNDNFTIASSIEKDSMTVIDIWQFSLGPRYYFRRVGLFTPYARACLVIGDLKWDAAPGSFDTGIGLEGGVGIDFMKNRFQLGIELSYKQMEYHYNEPADDEISATDDHIDMSGFVFSGTLSYWF